VGSGVLGAATSWTDVYGHTSVGYTLGTTPGTETIRATVAGQSVDFTATATVGAASSITLVSGDGQTGTVGSSVPGPLVVRVTDSYGNPVPNVTVSWAVTSGGGSVDTDDYTTDADGVAWVIPTLGTTPGINTFSASAAGIQQGVTFTLTANAGPPANMQIHAGDGQVAEPGAAVPLAPAVILTDNYGNPVAGASVTFSVLSGGGSITGASPTTNADGIATVGSWTLGNPGPQELRASAGDLEVVFTASSVAPELTVEPSAVWVNVGHTQQMTATLVGGSLAGPTWQSSDDGIASVDGTGLVTVHTAGVAIITATIDGVSGDATLEALATDPFTNSPLAAGANYSCVLDSNGTAQCWGINDLGQLGDGTVVRRASPAPVATNAAFTSISGGGASVGGHSCATTSSGAAYCWGQNGQGQLGLGNASLSVSSPMQVAGALNFQSITTGNQHSCGLTSERIVYCWGQGRTVGDGTTSDRSIPTAVSTNLRFRQISAGIGHTCGVTVGQEAYCWGRNESGQLGNGTTAEALVPVLVTGGLQWAAVGAGQNFTCGLTTGGVVHCWGSNFGGLLGDGTFSSRSSPGPVGGSNTYVALGVGGTRSCAITSNGEPFCWGNRSFVRTSGPTTSLFDNALTPTLVPVGAAVTAIAVGNAHSCALTSGGVLCWGSNEFGQLGQQPPGYIAEPAELIWNNTFSVVETADAHGCGLVNSTALCWGYNGAGQLGDNSTTNRLQPVGVSGNHQFQSITGGSDHTCALTSAGAAFCWGTNMNGQLGNGGIFPSSAPVAVTGGRSFDSIAAGWGHTCAIETTTGSAYCWGNGGFGQLGDGTNSAARNSPVAVLGGVTFSKIGAGYFHSCGLGRAPGDIDDQLYCWGNNSSGQLGTGNFTTSLTPVPVNSLLSFTDVTVGARHTCALTGSGSVYCWGGQPRGTARRRVLLDAALTNNTGTRDLPDGKRG
jgi:alpha-tubulin suppressor-like RCC1 family protein